MEHVGVDAGDIEDVAEDCHVPAARLVLYRVIGNHLVHDIDAKLAGIVVCDRQWFLEGSILDSR